MLKSQGKQSGREREEERGEGEQERDGEGRSKRERERLEGKGRLEMGGREERRFDNVNRMELCMFTH